MMLTEESVAEGGSSVQKTAAFRQRRFGDQGADEFLWKSEGMVGDTGIEPVASSV